jgi:hypothetical protein
MAAGYSTDAMFVVSVRHKQIYKPAIECLSV